MLNFNNKKSNHINLAIFASGAGTNAKKIIEDLAGNSKIIVKLIVSNKKEAGVLSVARNNNIDELIINRETFGSNRFLSELKGKNIDIIILAGFLWKIPEQLIKEYPDKIINIHPALLPNHGGQGMYGKFVHEAVIKSGALNSGITIHLVDEKYDNGKILFQATCPREISETAETLANKIHQLEHAHFSKVIVSYINFLTN